MSGHDDSAITIPLVIGVTGHRRLRDADIAGLQAQVRAFFLDLQQHYPDLPLVVLSPLAEGSDRLAAQVAFDLGLRVVAPLPLPVTLYRDDFDGPESLAIFERQLVQAEPLVLPHAQDAQLPGPARDRQYAEAGIFVSRHCHILLALWDGDDAVSLGGTAHVVRFHLHGEILRAGRHTHQRSDHRQRQPERKRLLHRFGGRQHGCLHLSLRPDHRQQTQTAAVNVRFPRGAHPCAAL